MKQNDAKFTISTLAGFLTKTNLFVNGSTESKLFLRKKSLENYLEKIFQDYTKVQIEQTLIEFKQQLKPGKYIRLNDEIDYPQLAKDLIATEESFLKKDKKRSPAIRESINQIISKINEQSKILQIQAYKDFFDSVESNPLTEAQREACVSDQCNTLVLAGAGSGKTSVMVARIGYLIKSGFATSNEILVVAFNSDAAKELKDRVNEKLSDLPDIENCHISTFHSLGKMIYDKTNNNSLTVAKHSSDEALYISIIEELINESLLERNFYSAFLEMYNATYFPEPEYEQINSEEDYKIYINNKKLRSLKGDILKGFGEIKIANYLYMSGIDYLYEPSYSKLSGVKLDFNYNPDFYIKDKELYLEHFGIDREGNTRPDINKEKYHQEMEKKRELHKENGTTLIESFHYELLDGSLTDNLEKKLNDHNVSFNPTPSDELFETINKLEKRTAIGTEIANTIKKIRANDLTKEEFEQKLNRQFNKYISSKIAFVISTILDKYNNYLKSNSEYTFEDMINKSAKLVKNRRYVPKWKYILVDEFQDISPQRAELITNIRDAQKEASLFCVGDDWQAINGFSGSELSYTVDFENKVGKCETILLDKTFRFDNQLSDLASKFIMQNPLQYKKHISTLIQSDKPSVILHAIGTNDYTPKIKEILKGIPPGSSVMFLNRNKLGFNIKKSFLKEYEDQYKLSTMRIHGSKGLEADYVIIFEVTSKLSGIPSLVKNTKIAKALLPTFDNYKYSEERRLFYVALTRAKKKCFIITEYNAPSTFVFELIDKGYNIDTSSVQLEKLYRSEPCHRCNSDLAKLISKAKKTYYKCSDYEYCNVMYYACIKCDSPMKPNGEYYGCSNPNCRFGDKEYICKCCNYGIVIPGISKNGNHYDRCCYKACQNPFQKKCIYCDVVFKDDEWKCKNPGCFASNWKCVKCGSGVTRIHGKYGEFYACKRKGCNWTQTKLEIYRRS